MLKFLATTENTKIIKSEEPIYNRIVGKGSKKAAGNCYSQFPDIEIHECRDVLFETDGRAIANNEETD